MPAALLLPPPNRGTSAAGGVTVPLALTLIALNERGCDGGWWWDGAAPPPAGDTPRSSVKVAIGVTVAVIAQDNGSDATVSADSSISSRLPPPIPPPPPPAVGIIAAESVAVVVAVVGWVGPLRANVSRYRLVGAIPPTSGNA